MTEGYIQIINKSPSYANAKYKYHHCLHPSVIELQCCLNKGRCRMGTPYVVYQLSLQTGEGYVKGIYGINRRAFKNNFLALHILKNFVSPKFGN